MGRELFNYRNHPPQFFFYRYEFGTRPRRFAADVDDVRAFGNHLFSMSDGAIDRDEFTAIAKTVRRDIENSHHQRPLSVVQKTAGEFPFTWRHRLSRLIGPGDEHRGTGRFAVSLLNMVPALV